MLPKVSSALSALIAPITSSSSQGANQTSSGQKAFDRFKAPKGKSGEKGSQSQQEEKPAQVIPLVPKESREANSSRPIAADQALAAPQAPNTGALSVAHAFVQLLGMFGRQSGAIAQWIGNRAYQNVSAQKKGSKFKRGAMLDTLVE